MYAEIIATPESPIEIVRGSTVVNLISGERGIVRSIWTNFAGQPVVNVRVNGMMVSWNMVEVL